MPIPGSRVIPAGWSAHHRPTATGTMTGRLEVYAPAPRSSILDAGGGEPVAVDIPCRVQQLNRASNGANVGQETHLRDYLITVPAGTPVRFRAGQGGHTLRITQADNPDTVGDWFTVKQVMRGSLTWEIDLICEHNQAQQEGGR